MKKGAIEMEQKETVLKKYIFTFGIGHPFAGFAQPIYAKNHATARQRMWQLHGAKWGFQYDELDWEKAKLSSKEHGYKLETELEPMYVREDSEK